MNRSKFTRPPLVGIEREKKLEAFINLTDTPTNKKEVALERHKKEKIKQVHIRLPESLLEDIREITARTGLSMNAICSTLLRPEIKRKLKELRED